MRSLLDTRADRPVYTSTLEWFESQADGRSTRASYRKVHDATRIKYPPPRGLEEAGDMFHSIRQRGLPEAYVAIVPNGFVCGNGDRSPTAVLAPDGKLIWDVSRGYQRVEDHWIFGETDLPEPTLVSETTGVLAIRPQWSRGYFHWMFEVLPRIHLFRGSGLQIEKIW